jgi:hypothetical protein
MYFEEQFSEAIQLSAFLTLVELPRMMLNGSGSHKTALKKPEIGIS